MKKIKEETGAEITLEPERMIPPFINNAAFYMEQVPGMRAVFLAGKPDQPNYPVHNPAFDLDESVLTDALEFLFHMVTEP